MLVYHITIHVIWQLIEADRTYRP